VAVGPVGAGRLCVRVGVDSDKAPRVMGQTTRRIYVEEETKKENLGKRVTKEKIVSRIRPTRATNNQKHEKWLTAKSGEPRCFVTTRGEENVKQDLRLSSLILTGDTVLSK
jgi:outer membrane lipoprotein-sorting protein